MKSKRKPSVAIRSPHMLSELVEIVKTSARRAEMERYLNGGIHAEMLIVGSLVEQCENSQRNLLKGVISPHLDVCCCADTFASTLTACPCICYEGCELPEADGENGSPVPEEDVGCDSVIDDATFARLSKLPVEKLRQSLIAEWGCEGSEYAQGHEGDLELQCAYHAAVLRRFEAAARYAKAIGSESARLWLEAVCLLSPCVQLENSISVKTGLKLDPDGVARAYEVAQRAQRALWVDDALRKLPAARLPRKTRMTTH